MVVRDAPVVSHVEHSEHARRPRRVEVVEVLDVTPRMRRVRLAGDLHDLPVSGPTDHAKLFFPPAPGEEPPEPRLTARGLAAPPAGTPRPYREYTLRRHDPAVAVGDDDGRLVARRQDVPDRGDVLRQAGPGRVRRLVRLAAARQRGRLAGDAPLGQQRTRRVPPPRSVLHAGPVHENDPHAS